MGSVLGGVTLGGALLIGLVMPAGSQGGRYAVGWQSVDGGGGASGSQRFELMGTIGQPDAGASSGTRFSLTGGLWAPVDAEPGVRHVVFMPSLQRRDRDN